MERKCPLKRRYCKVRPPTYPYGRRWRELRKMEKKRAQLVDNLDCLRTEADNCGRLLTHYQKLPNNGVSPERSAYIDTLTKRFDNATKVYTEAQEQYEQYKTEHAQAISQFREIQLCTRTMQRLESNIQDLEGKDRRKGFRKFCIARSATRFLTLDPKLTCPEAFNLARIKYMS
jgi:hypothetical protein